jgi:murein DD-endopeptidase MepM/ murein hydrolase activator NlpD
MAAGDHLHYAVLIRNTFVNPIEWWDAGWIKNNITDKIKDAQAAIK